MRVEHYKDGWGRGVVRYWLPVTPDGVTKENVAVASVDASDVLLDYATDKFVYRTVVVIRVL